MKVARRKIEEFFIKSCSVAHIFTGEEIVQDHMPVYQVSGQTFIDQQGRFGITRGTAIAFPQEPGHQMYQSARD